MFADQYPHFEKDRVLKADMLMGLRDYPRDYLELFYEEYSDGIISGVKLVVEDDKKTLLITPGMLKFKGHLYFMQQSYHVPYEAYERVMYLRVKFLEREESSDYTLFKSQILLEEEKEQSDDEMELGRFLLKEGAKLRQDYQNLRDFTTEHNTINRIHVPYAGRNGTTITPEFTIYYGKQLMQYHTQNPYDIAFAMICLQENTVSRDSIVEYLKERKELSFTTPLTNIQIHEYMVSIMDEVMAGKTVRNIGERIGRRVIVE